MTNVLAETEVVSHSLPSSYTLVTQREPDAQVRDPVTPEMARGRDPAGCSQFGVARHVFWLCVIHCKI